ncbi:hypothetical protein [Pseudocolwellia agarivorans]|uniref:hypothetical protein n=1 Tax=Pseudocolwellia agarivorans TaxID=1911682 RepID=UPI000985E6AC|nr:hypothetical protein [Pseudocolwellia agarivorans]
MKFVVLFILSFSSMLVQAEVNFRVPSRDYINVKGDWNIFYEASLKRSNPQLAKESLLKLKSTLKSIEKKLPRNSLRKLKTLKIFLMFGENSPHGGKKSGMRFVRRGETNKRLHYDNKWEHSIVIYSAKNLMYLTDMWAKKALTHELAHAWHIMHWPDKYAQILNPWKNAKSKGLYKNVKDYKNRIKPNAYAIKNNLEYFAELSAMYFVGGDYYPYEKIELAKYDPMGVAMVKRLWSVR